MSSVSFPLGHYDDDRLMHDFDGENDHGNGDGDDNDDDEYPAYPPHSTRQRRSFVVGSQRDSVDESMPISVAPAAQFADMHLTILSSTLTFLSVAKRDLCHVTYRLLQSFLCPNAGDAHFFSFTQTESEYSLILTVEAAALFRLSCGAVAVQSSAEHWRAIEVIDGDVEVMSEFEVTSGLVTTISRVLAARGVSIFYLSTYQTDYVLVKLADLPAALSALETHFTDADVSINAGDGHAHSDDTSKAATTATAIPASDIELDTLSSDLYLIALNAADISPYIRTLIDCAFFTQTSFFSFTHIHSTVNIVVDHDALARLTQTQHDSPLSVPINVSPAWTAFRVKGEWGFDETGLVYALSQPLTSHDICPFYFSTFDTDYVLVQTKQKAAAMEILKRTFEVSQQTDNAKAIETNENTPAAAAEKH